MKSAQLQKSTKVTAKTEEASTSAQDEHRTDSITRLVNSQNLTVEIAVNYLYNFRKNLKLTIQLLERLKIFCLTKSAHYIPTIIYILNLENSDQQLRFSEFIAQSALPLYLLVRWSHNTFGQGQRKSVQHVKNKLDSSLIGKMKYPDNEEFNEEKLKDKIKEKENYSNYLSVLNDFYERLFKIPEKLKKYQQSKRNQKLASYLIKITRTFMKDQAGFINGITVPVDDSSCINVRVLTDYCFTFSTKQRVPFKLVFETISLEDLQKCKDGILPSKDQNEDSPVLFKSQRSLIMPTTYFGELWQDSEQKIKRTSPYSSIPSYKIRSYMVKSGDDLRQQYLAMQLIKFIAEIAKSENIKIWIRPYDVIPYNGDSGLIQFVPNTKTVSYLKQKSKQKSLRKIYQQIFGTEWEESVINFIESLAGYSLIQYLFEIKDRHNNNILVDTQGHIIHIDFSFMLSSSPGNMNFERAPFKLTEDYLELMEGQDSDIYKHFKMLFFLGLKFLRKYKKEIMETVIMMSSCTMKCFQKFDREAFQRRFHDNATDEELEIIVNDIMKDAFTSYTTSGYDKYQWYTNFIYS